MYKEYIEFYKTYTQKYGAKTAIFLMVGSFYELYDIQDAETGETECNVREIVDMLGIQLSTKKEEDSKMCLFAGFPDYVMHKWAGRLTSVGYTVVIVDQYKDMRGKVKERKVSRILSPSTHIENISANETAYVITLFMDQREGPPQFGAAILDITTGKTMTFSCTASGRADIWTADDLVQLLHIYQPKELVIYWRNGNKPEESVFRKMIHSLIHIRECTSSAFDRELVRTEYLQKIYAPKSILPIKTYLGLRTEQEELALLYLLQFTEEHYASMLTSLHRNEPWVPHSKLVCGNHALSQLQMIQADGVIGLFTKCITSMGKRGIRERLLSPYSDSQQIRLRLEEVKEYLSWSKEKVMQVERQFRFMYDLPRLHRKIICASITSDEIAGLFQTYHAVERIIVLTKDTCLKQPFTDEDWLAYNQLFETHFSKDKPVFCTPFNVETYPDIGRKEQDIQRVMEQLEILRMDFNALLKEDAVRLEEREKEPFGLKTSTIQLKQLKKQSLPEGTEITELKSGGWIDCTQLQQLNKQLARLREELKQLVSITQMDACQAIVSTGFWQLVEDWICHLDCTQCIGYTSKQNAWTCPVITDTESDSGFDIKQIRHPLVEASATRVSYVKHDISLGFSDAGEQTKNGWLVYGMNASGKSTLMKATGICILLAQAGCFVPAKEMTLTPFRAVYTRILNQDNIHAGLSSFAVEMSELRDILRNATPHTLVLGDELCAGTESVSAQALVASGIQWLSEKKAKFIFATHLHDLPSLIQTKDVDIWHLHVEYDPVTRKLTYDRTLRPGSGSSLYGLEVARAMDLPFEFIEQALKNREKIMGSVQTSLAKSSAWNRDIVRKECEVCKKQIVSELEVHHISPRASAVNQRVADGSHMNDKRNLIVICQTCHDAVHADMIEIAPLTMTSDGPERGTVTTVTAVTEPAPKQKQKGKWSDEEMEIIMKMLRTYSSLSIKAIKGKLSQIHSIEISDAMLGKFKKTI
jgi:DNA mismatch repair protein MutS